MATRIPIPEHVLPKMAKLELTNPKLAEIAGVGLSSTRRAADPDYRKPMSTVILQRLAKALDCDLDDISTEEPARQAIDATTVGKVLDLRPYGAKQGPYETPLTCYYRFRRFPDSRCLELHAATTSKKASTRCRCC